MWGKPGWLEPVSWWGTAGGWDESSWESWDRGRGRVCSQKVVLEVGGGGGRYSVLCLNALGDHCCGLMAGWGTPVIYVPLRYRSALVSHGNQHRGCPAAPSGKCP